MSYEREDSNNYSNYYNCINIFYNLIENNDDFAPYECKEYDKDYNLCTDVYDLLEIKSELTDIAQEYEKD